MSAAHNFQNDDNDDQSNHSLLEQAKFTFTSGEEGAKIFSPQERRTAFIHHLQPGPYMDTINKDIAMIKLGRQPGSAQLKPWESCEEKDLTELNLTNFATMDEREVRQCQNAYAIHYGGDDNERKMVEQTVRAVTEPTDAISYGTIRLGPAVQKGASGCPIINQNFHLVGMLFCGDGVGDRWRIQRKSK